ncbi:VOC family protein [Pedobacter sp.]|uniref:VOC family protein n=1 Tax=Pedobacter sp. TaxID=1411316 RepID=UPI003D7F1C53
MIKTDVYLNFDGTTEEAFNFYKSVFGGEFAPLMRYGEVTEEEMPGCKALSDDEKNKVMHVTLPIDEHTVLMGTDSLSSMGPPLTMGNNFSISLSFDSREEATRYFKGLSAGGEVVMPLQKVFWSELFGILVDPYGVQWMINYYPTPESA